MADASESPETPPDSARDATPEAPPEAPTDRKPAAKKGTRAPAAAPPILTRYRLAQDLGSSLRNYEGELTRALEEVLSPFAEDGERLQLTPLLRAVGRLVEARQHQLERAHYQHHEELSADKERQRETRRRFQELRQLMVDLRQTVRSLYGRTVVKEFLGFEQPTGREPLLLLRQAQRVLHQIQDPDRPRPQPRFSNQTVDWDWWVDQLEPATRALGQAVYEKDDEAAETQLAHRAKELELEGYDRQVHAAARWIAATFELADRKRFGNDLRPFAGSRLRRSKTDSEKEPEKEPGFERSGGGTGNETETSPTPASASAQGASKGT